MVGGSAVARLESYPARDGMRIPMSVRYPARCVPEVSPGGESCPVVVEFHGGPEGQAQPGFNPYAHIARDLPRSREGAAPAHPGGR